MKLHHYLTLLAFVSMLGLGFMFKINEAPAQRTGAPGENACGSCHSGNVNSGPASMNLSLPAAYIPGQTYTLAFSAVDSVSFPNPRFGFTATSLDVNDDPIGAFIVTNTTNTSIQTGVVQGDTRSYLGHTNANSTNTWLFDWTAPSANVGDITFYTSNVVANANNSTSGDFAYTNTFTLSFLATFPQPVITATDSMICGSETVTFGEASQGNIDTYAWDFGAGASPATASGPGPHVIQWTTPGTKTVSLSTTGPDGTASKSSSIIVNDQPSAVASTPMQSLCEGDTGQPAGVQLNGGTMPFTYAWSCNLAGNLCGISNPAIQNPTLNPDITPGIDTASYTLQITDVNGCATQPVEIDIVRLFAPMLDVNSAELLYCVNDPSLILGAGLDTANMAPGPFTYSWQPGTGLADPTSPITAASPSMTTTYVLTAVSGSNGCASLPDANDSLTIFASPVIQAEAGPDQVACLGETLSLQGSVTGVSTEINIRWTSDDPSLTDSSSLSPTVTPTQTTTYYMEADGGCENATIDSVRVIIGGAPTVDLGTDMLSVCAGDSVQLAADISGPEPTYNLSWTGSDGAIFNADSIVDPVVFASTSQSLILTASSTGGCGSTSDSLMLEVLDAPLPVLTQMGNDSLLAPAGAAFYQWYLVDDQGDTIAIAGENNAYLLFDSIPQGGPNVGTLQLLIRYTNGCERLSEPFASPLVNSLNDLSFSDLRAYPNPVSGQLNVFYRQQQAETVIISLRDLQGRLIYQHTQAASLEAQHGWQIDQLAAGLYLLDVRSASARQQLKILVE